jgi:ankyrin repeat protein
MESIDALEQAIKTNDVAAVSRVLDEHPDVKSRLDEPLPHGAFGQTALLAAVQRPNRELMDVLLRAGANINRKSHWWAGGFHVLDDAWREPWLTSFLIDRGAVPEIHHAVRLGMVDDVRRMLAGDANLIQSRGGDGQLPLHFAQSVEMAALLLNFGADIDARDVDHESTAAQWMVRDRSEVARFLVQRGCRTDVLMASALGDGGLVARLLDANPDAIRTSVSEEYFPKVDPRAGGAIYVWTLGANKTAHLVAREFGHDELFRLLMDRTPDEMKLAVLCELVDETLVEQLVAAHPGLVATLSAANRRKLADAAQDNNNAAVELMLKTGWPVDVRGQHNATPLHWAGFHGNADMARVLLAHHAPVNVKGDEFDGTPLQWAMHGSVHGWRCATGDYPATVDVMLSAGAEAPPITDRTQGTPAVIAVLRRHAEKRGQPPFSSKKGDSLSAKD